MDRAQEIFQRLIDRGEAALDELIVERVSEELFLEFKASPDNGNGQKLHHADREKLAKAISGFGNSEGGVVVWGIDCERLPIDGDVAQGKRPIQKPTRFKSWLEAAVSGCTLPPHEGVRHHVICSERSADEGFVLTLVPKSLRSPHQCIVEPNRHRYYMRVGSNFDHVPHGVLAGMFGRQPQPYIFHFWTNFGGAISPRGALSARSDPAPTDTPFVRFGFMLRNEGASVARDLYANFELFEPGPNCAFRVHPVEFLGDGQSWTYYRTFEHVHHVVSPDGFKLAPGAMAEVVRIEFYIRPPFDGGLSYQITFGATGTPVNTLTHSVPCADVQTAYDAFLRDGQTEDAFRAMHKSLFQTDPAE